MRTTTATILWEHVREADLCPGAESLEAWLGVRWIRARIGGHAVPVLPVIGYRNALVLHDVHHIVTGYGTQLTGELELAAWELASGGCGLNAFFWIDRCVAVLLGLVVAPRRLAHAFRRGWGRRNLYGARAEDVLAANYAEVVAKVERGR